MYQERFQQIKELADDRDTTLRKWLQWLILITTGALSVVIPLSNIESFSPVAAFFFKATCICCGIGILSLTIRIYAFIVGKKSLISGLVKSMETLDNTPICSDIPEWMMLCEPIGYIALLLGMTCLITFVCVR